MSSNHSRSTFMKHGYTVIEIMIVIFIIAMLVTLVVVGIGGWRQHEAEGVVQHDLNNVRIAMENARNFNNTYPGSLPSSFTESNDVDVTLKSSTGTDYCVEAKSLSVITVVYSVRGSNNKVVSGPCP
jgi:prepilin-type N-terminal cleavage/methylation domain-containing protein